MPNSPANCRDTCYFTDYRFVGIDDIDMTIFNIHCCYEDTGEKIQQNFLLTIHTYTDKISFSQGLLKIQSHCI